MARTKADAGKKAGGKASRKAPVLRNTPTPKAGGISKRKTSGGTRNSCCKRPTPKWQVPIKEFLTKAGPSAAAGAAPDVVMQGEEEDELYKETACCATASGSTGTMSSGMEVEDSAEEDEVKGSEDEVKEGSEGEVKEGSEGEVKEGSEGEVKEGSEGEVKEGSEDEVKGSEDEVKGYEIEVITISEDEVNEGSEDEEKEGSEGEVKEGSEDEVNEVLANGEDNYAAKEDKILKGQNVETPSEELDTTKTQNGEEHA